MAELKDFESKEKMCWVVLSLCITLGSMSYSTNLILSSRSFGGYFSRSVIMSPVNQIFYHYCLEDMYVKFLLALSRLHQCRLTKYVSAIWLSCSSTCWFILPSDLARASVLSGHAFQTFNSLYWFILFS
jgi:hypothetical protein